MPADVVERLQSEHALIEKQPRKLGESPRDRALRLSKLLFARTDAYLGAASIGPLLLKEPACAKIVEDAILFSAVERFELYAWCIMANHAHALFTPIWDFRKLMQSIKGFTSRQINQLQSQMGRTLWQDESYDHWVRDEAELLRVVYYIEQNPVKAGLCREAKDWPWSSARFRTNWAVGQAFSLTDASKR